MITAGIAAALLLGGAAAIPAHADTVDSACVGTDPVGCAINGDSTTYQNDIWQLLNSDDYMTAIGNDGFSIADYVPDSTTQADWLQELGLASADADAAEGASFAASSILSGGVIDAVAVAAGGFYVVHHLWSGSGAPASTYVKYGLSEIGGDSVIDPTSWPYPPANDGETSTSGSYANSCSSALCWDEDIGPAPFHRILGAVASMDWTIYADQPLGPGVEPFNSTGGWVPDSGQAPCETGDGACTFAYASAFGNDTEIGADGSAALGAAEGSLEALMGQVAGAQLQTEASDPNAEEETACSCSSPAVTASRVFVPAAQFQSDLVDEGISTSAPSGGLRTATYTTPATPNSDIWTDTSLDTDLAQPCLRQLLDYYLNSSDYLFPQGCDSEGNPIAQILLIPPATANQTCDEYVEQLATFGYTGDASCVTLPEADTNVNVGPSAPVRISVPASDVVSPNVTAPTAVFDPTPGGMVPPFPWTTPTAAITIYANPSDAPPVPTTSANGGAGGGSCTGPSVPALDFTPLTTLDYGSKFPFGSISWVVNGVTGWEGSSTDPAVSLSSFDFLYPSAGTQSGSSDLSVFDPFMDAFRSLILLECVIGAVWGYGTAALGWGRGNEQLTIPGV